MMERKYGPEELKNEASRTISDAELIKGGAKYVMDEGTSNPRLELTKEQIARADNHSSSLESWEKNLTSLKGIELVEAVTEVLRELKEVTREFGEKQPELATIFNLKQIIGELDERLKTYESPDSYVRTNPPDSPEAEQGYAIDGFYGKLVAHRLFRILYLIAGYDLADQNLNPECARDCQELYMSIEKLRLMMKRMGALTPSPADSSDKLFTPYDNIKNSNTDRWGDTKKLRELPAAIRKIQELVKSDGYKSRIIDISEVGIWDTLKDKIYKLPKVIIGHDADWGF